MTQGYLVFYVDFRTDFVYAMYQQLKLQRTQIFRMLWRKS